MGGQRFRWSPLWESSGLGSLTRGLGKSRGLGSLSRGLGKSRGLGRVLTCFGSWTT